MSGTADVFSVVDPKGYRIRCILACWNEHVLPEHKSLEGREQDVALAVREPDFGFVFQDRNFENRRVYYRRDGTRRLYIKVVAEVDVETRTGEVITAFHAADRPDGEKLL